MSVAQKKAGELIIHGKKYRAVVYDIDGREVELYRIGALAHALEHTVQQVCNWEREGLFPKPLYKISGGFGNCNRWYSKEQITNLRKVWVAFPLRKGHYKCKKDFFKYARIVFYKPHIVTLSFASENKNGKQDGKQQPVSNV